MNRPAVGRRVAYRVDDVLASWRRDSLHSEPQSTVIINTVPPWRFGVAGGGPPLCPYGYYEVPPYACAPDGYYARASFNAGVFIGAGPWYHSAETRCTIHAAETPPLAVDSGFRAATVRESATKPLQNGAV